MVRKSMTFEKVSAVLKKAEQDSNREKSEITIDAQIESAQGLVNCEQIARSTRVTSLNFGPADFMADLGMTAEEVTSKEYALMRILVAARVAGIVAIDGPTLEVLDIAKFESSACLLEAYEYFTSAAGGGRGAAIYKGAMIDQASRKMALATVARGSAAGLEPTKHFLP